MKEIDGLNIVILGSSEFAVPLPQKLLDKGHRILAVVTQPDKPNRRGNKTEFLPMKKRAIELGLPVFQPERINSDESIMFLKKLSPDVFVVAAYGQILSKKILEIPKFGCINIHGSLLPKYRGAAPIHHAIIDGENEIGITLMQMDTGMDTGAMYCKKSISVEMTTTVGEAHDRLAKLGANLLAESLLEIVNNEIKPIKQDDTMATYADKIDKCIGKINFSENSIRILKRINGTDPYPGAYTTLNGKIIKCFKPKMVSYSGAEKPGTILKADTKAGLIVKTSDGAIQIDEIQLPGKKRMEVKNFFIGNKILETCFDD